MLKRIIAVLATATLTLGLALGAAMPASAHVPDYKATCGSLDLNLYSYSGGANYVTVTIDGAAAQAKTSFSGSFVKSFTWSTTATHTFKIEIDATENDWDRLGANAITGTFGPCTTTTVCLNPLSQNKGFTILTEGDFTSDMSGAHVEGTVAAGGDLVIKTRYTTQNNHDGTPIPIVDGKSTGLLVGGKATLTASNQAFSVMQGVFRIGTVPDTAAIKESKRYHPVSSSSSYIEGTSNITLDDVKGAGLFGTTFSGAFTTLRANAATIAGYTGSNVQFVTMSNSGNGGKQVTLVAGVTNVLRVSGSSLSSAGQLWFAGGVVPSASTPFIIDVTDSGSFNVTAPVLRNIDAQYVLWNFSKATSLGLSTSEFIEGSVLAPNADVSLNGGGLEGQIAAKTMTVKSVGEIHHITYKPCLTTPTSVSGAATTAAATCDTTSYVVKNGSVTATAKTGVSYQLWNQAKTTKIADLTAGTAYPIAAGTYYVRVLATSNAYTVSSGNEWIEAVVGAYAGTCEAPQDVSGAATTKAQTCDANFDLQNGSVTATVKTGVTYQLWNQAKDAKIADLTAGTAYPIANGTYFVKVLPASSAYTVSVANTWIEAVVGPYAGTCAESVTGAATSAAETCDTTVYEVKNGSVTATVKTGVTYQLWNAAKTNKIADLVAGTPYAVPNGTYYVRVIAASGKYTVSAGNEWIQVVVGKYTGLCAQDVTGAAGASTETCDANYDIKLGSVTATVKTGVTYQLWSADKGTKIADLTAGTAYPIGNGAYWVKVLPLTNKYNVTSANEWIPVSVGTYTGLCAQDTSGSVTPGNETCQTTDWTIQKGSVLANAASGVKYELWNQTKTTKLDDLVIGTPYALSHGDYYVRVLPLTSKYNVSSANEWIPVQIIEFTGICAQDVSGSATPSVETCDTTDYTIAKGSITPAVVNGVRYELWTADKSTKISDLTAGVENKVDGGTYWVRVIAITTKYNVSAANEWIQQIVGDFTGTCAQDVKGSAVTAGEVCSATNYNSVKPADYAVSLGSVTAGKAEGVSYELWNQAKDTKIADLTAEQAYAVKGGTYYVKVLPLSSKYDVSSANQWIQVVVPTNTKVCEVIGDPTKFEACVVDPTDFDKSNWTAYLTIVAVDHVQYHVYVSNGTTFVDKGIWAAGKYNAGTADLPLGSIVKVVAEPESGWSLLAPKDWTIPFAKGFDCDLSTNGVVEPNVIFAQTCAAGPTYELTIDGGVAGSVLWSVNGGPTTTQLGTFSVTPGSTVKIVATPAPGAGFTGNGQAALSRTFEKTFTSGAECDLETLAFTGQDISGYLVIAVILFQAGLALVAVQFIRARRQARHLAS